MYDVYLQLPELWRPVPSASSNFLPPTLCSTCFQTALWQWVVFLKHEVDLFLQLFNNLNYGCSNTENRTNSSKRENKTVVQNLEILLRILLRLSLCFSLKFFRLYENFLKVFGLQQEVSTQGLQLFWHFETEWVLKNLKVPPLTFSDTVTLFKKSHFFYFSLFSASKVYPIHFLFFMFCNELKFQNGKASISLRIYKLWVF